MVIARITRHASLHSEVADEGFFLEPVNPLFLQVGLLLGAEGFFDVVADFGERLGRARAVLSSTSMR